MVVVAAAAADAAVGVAGDDTPQPDRPGSSVMIQVSRELCTGCGACLAVCPRGALFVVDSCADVDVSLCDACGRCIEACPEGAISFKATEPQALVQAQPPLPAEAQTRAVAPLWSRSIVPALGAAIAFAGREILPRVVQTLISTRRTGNSATTTSGANEGRRLRRRRRGGA